MNTAIAILIVLLLILLGVVAFLVIKNIESRESLKKLKNTNQKINSLGIIQDFIKIIGNNMISSKEKIEQINEMMIEKYEIKYSTFVIFDGSSYVIEATNVNEKHWNTFLNLQNNDIFRESIENATPKYITVEKGEKLPYLDSEFERAKSTIFFPLYVDNVYIGYWLIEGNKPHEFDNIDTTILEVVKNNLLSSYRAIKSQIILENLVREDSVTGLSNEEYLYTGAIKVIDKYPTSIVSLVKIINFQQIEEKVSKKTANSVITQVSNYIIKSLSPEYFTVRYSNDMLAIVFSGSDVDGVGSFLEDVKENVEKIRVRTSSSIKESMNGLLVAPKLNIAMTTYYKETALEEVLKDLSNYLENADSSESDITCI